MTARDRILGKLRAALGPRDDEAARRAVEERLAARAAGVVPAIARTEGQGRVAQFVAKLQGTVATIDHGADVRQAGRCIARYLAERELSPVARLVATPHPMLDELSIEPGPDIAFDLPQASDRVGISVADLGLAESGSLVFLSSPQSPASFHFVPETEIVLLSARAVVAGMEDVWAYLRLKHQGAMPRAVHLVTGPSRTADIELTLTMGAHGPRNLHVILVGGEAAT